MSKSVTIVERILKGTAGVLALAFLATGIFFLCNGHVTVTSFDMWYLYEVSLDYPFLQAAALKYGVHSLFFPSLIWISNIELFHNNQQVLFTIGLVLLISSASLLSLAIWRDYTIGTTTKIVATLVVIVGNFSMGRASITAIGPFNCICSLVVLGAIGAFYVLLAICLKARFFWLWMSLLAISGWVSSFSFGSGFAVWPTLLLLGWSARLPWRILALVFCAGIVAVIIYFFLPGATPHIAPQDAISIPTALRRWCTLLGIPFLYAAKAWTRSALPPAAEEASGIPFVCGVIGAVITILIIVARLVRRDLGGSRLKFMASALTIFNFIAIGFIVVGRTAQVHAFPGEEIAPRYMFWGFLFWTGLFLCLALTADWNKSIRWPAFIALGALPILAWPQHYRGALWARNVQRLMETGATGLINGVKDSDKVAIMYRNPVTTYRMAKRFRDQRLDMFASGLQDWIGVPASSLSNGQARSVNLEGNLAVEAKVESDDGKPAVRITGWAIEGGKRIPRQIVFVDSTGKVCGLARPTQVSWRTNARFKLGRFATSGFLGYIRDYNPQASYLARSVDSRGISTQSIAVPAAKSEPVVR